MNVRLPCYHLLFSLYHHVPVAPTKKAPSNKARCLGGNVLLVRSFRSQIPDKCINDLGEYSSDKDGKVKLELTTGDNIINVYSSKCNIKLDEIKVKLPIFNPYSLDPLCKGVDSSEFSLCKKYYKPSVTYSEFVKRVKSYRVTNKIKDNNNNGNDIDNTNIFTKIISYLVKYKYYVIGIGSVLIVTPIVIVSVKKRRNRGVLK